MRALGAVLVLGTLWAGLPADAGAQGPPPRKTSRPGVSNTGPDRECLVCHAGIGEPGAPKLNLDLYRASAHGSVGCVSCHQDIENAAIEHEQESQDLAPVDCGSCHEDQKALFARSVHRLDPGARAAGDERPRPTCATCHGSHNILPPVNLASRTHPLHLLATCGECHGTERKAAGHTLEVPAKYRALLKTVDSSAVQKLMDQGLLVTAGCADCHRPHDIISPGQPGSSLQGPQAIATCGRCHAEQRAQFTRSAHGAALAAQAGGAGAGESGRSPPTCATCHAVHHSLTPRTAQFRLDIVNECGTCHAALMKSYQESYHGKATLLGDASVAKCSDCHGPHEILPPANPASSVNPDNKPKTCRKCHEGAPARFAKFWPHADPHQRDRYPALYWMWVFMTGLLVSVFAFFGLHTLLWGIREAVDAVRARKQPRHKPGGPPIERFARFHRVVHAFVIVSFLGLAATGAPLKFAHTSWAHAIFAVLGGVSAAGWWHRLFAIITFGYFSSHVVYMIRRLRAHARGGTLGKALLGPDSIVPSLSDVRDIAAHFRWFVGAGSRPTWDRFTYWEKFDYWAVFWGVAIIGTTGLMLWFPTFFSLLLPGWFINVAFVVHSDEALLAIGFIFGVHFFNGHLRRSKFPMDPVMFTGTVPEEEYREERGREWARMEATDTVEKRRGKPVSRQFLRWVRVFGILAWLVGLGLLGLILHGTFFS